ncbi:MAG: enterotoxin [Terracidiphilus sp.]
MYRLNGYRIAAFFALSFAALAALRVSVCAQEAGDPGPATIRTSGDTFQLQNHAIGATVSVKDGRISGLTVTDRLHGTSIPISSPFAILFKDGTIDRTDDMTVSLKPNAGKVASMPNASRASEKIGGAEIEIALDSDDHVLHVVWSIILHNGSGYLRQLLEIRAVGHDAPINRVELIDLMLPNARVSGSVEGSPIVAGNLFLGFEHPLSHSKVTGGRATAWIDRDLPLRAGQKIVYSSVIGVAHEGQIRRDFLAYLERERAHPYRTFLHYNSWYDLGYFDPYDQAGALDRVNAFGRELTEKRGVKLDSFLFDDGWDNHKSLWKFNDGFPDGFAPIRDAAAHYGASPGVWMSPWGGYSKPKQERIAFGKAAGYEIVDGGYALSGPRYYAAFRDVCLSMVRDYGVNQFKFDGTGNVDSVFPGSQFDSDFAATIHLIGELREAKPDIFINLTTGTWPSPFWLLYADSIWRGGEDDSTAGVGPYRERWITYRDAETYRRVVENGPLYPLNSLMLHGLILAQHHKQLDRDPGNDFRNEVRSYFGTGTQLQEMYITPSLLSDANWDDLAEAANWSRANADVLKDTHWIGGDPAWLEVYGWASWSPRKGVLVLRNPSDRVQAIGIKLQKAFELPAHAAQVYHAKSPWKDDAGRRAIVLQANEAHVFHLAPFEVLTLDILPGESAH